MTLPGATDVLIVGGGLAGLRLADMLGGSGHDFQLIEARDRFGGRVLSHHAADAAFDLGPAWFWPGQPRIAALAERFNLSVFEQYAQGAFRFEDTQGRIQQGHGAVSMQGSFRIDGGISTLCDRLAGSVKPARLHLNAQLIALSRTGTEITAKLADGRIITARQVVCALPPRLTAALAFSPALPATVSQTLAAVPTWMAGQAKAIAVYKTPFWRHAGLSGDAMSQRGPMVEIHDASPADARTGALFGFIGVPAAQRADSTALENAVRAQFIRLFGEEATHPLALEIKDWAFDPNTATNGDHAPLTAHPHYGMPPALQGLWDGALVLGGTEVATDFGGFLEGALEAAENTFQTVSRSLV